MVALRNDLSPSSSAASARAFFERDEQVRIYRTLAASPVFEGLSEESLGDLTRRVQVKRVPGGRSILGRGDRADALFVIMGGRAKVVIAGDNGREITLRILRAGDVFGELALFGDDGRGAEVVALEPVTALALSRDELLEHMNAQPTTAVRFLGEMSRRLRAADETIAELALCDVQQRLVRRLVRLARQEGHEAGGELVLRRRPTQQDLANMVGSCRETVSRTFNAMVRKGLLRVVGRSLVLGAQLVRDAEGHAAEPQAA